MSVRSARRVEPGRPRGTGDPGTVLLAGLVGVLVLMTSFITIAVRSGGSATTWNPFTTTIKVITGEIPWTTGATVAAVIEGILLMAAAVALAGWWARRVAKRVPIDGAADLLAHGNELAPFTEPAARAFAQRVGIPDHYAPGLLLGEAVASAQKLFQNWELCSVDIWGPRRGKTSTQAIQAIADAPGAVLATSNKFDALLKATRAWRQRLGRVWVFDIQQVAGERPKFWWNPLTYVIDDVTAENLTAVFAGSETIADSGGSNAFFTKASARLVKALLRAAAVGGAPITTVLEWLTDHQRCDEAEQMLRDAGLDALADQVVQQMYAPDKQRGGIFETAANWLACVGMDTVRPWVTDPGDGRPHLDINEFVRSSDTLYCLSRNSGAAGAGQVVAALVQAVGDAAEAHASRSGGRMPVPLTMVLDEAANVVQWHRLPDVYSYYGSQGIIIKTYFQSYEQGIKAFGREGMDMLWDSANLRTYGGGTASTRFLEDIVKLCGRYSYRSRSSSHAERGGGSTSYQIQTEDILTIADLQSMPTGRALVIPSGAPPILLRTTGWYEDPDRKELQRVIGDAELRALTLEAQQEDSEFYGPQRRGVLSFLSRRSTERPKAVAA